MSTSQIQENVVASLHMTLTDGDGTLLMSTVEDDDTPLLYLHGVGGMPPTLEQELEGCEIGDTVALTLSPEEAYGAYDPRLEMELPREDFPDDDELQAGMPIMLAFEGEDSGEEEFEVFWIKDVTDEVIKVDGNHPLAGKTLSYAIEVVALREATKDEIEHGHAHGEGGHVH